MIRNWNDHLAATVKRLISDVMAGRANPFGRKHADPLGFNREAAQATGGLPCWGDMGGFLVITPGGAILGYDLENNVEEVRDEKWRRIALASAARMYPELCELMPTRPDNAVTCGECKGTGKVMDGQMLCSRCGAAGRYFSFPEKNKESEVVSRQGQSEDDSRPS